MFQLEGTTDDAVLHSLVEKVLGRKVEPVRYQKRSGGMPPVISTLNPALWQAWKLGCVGAVVGVDANGTPPHDQHGPEPVPECRHCQLARHLPTLPERPEGRMHLALAVPVQAIEAWLLAFGHVVNRRPAGPPQSLDRRDAKRLLYGTVTPSPAEVRAVCDQILRAMDGPGLDRLAQDQPSFRAFRDQLRAWPTR